MKNLFVVLMIVLIVISWVAPVAAQEATVVDYGTPVTFQQNELYPLVVTGLLFILFAALTVLGYSIRKIAESAPPWMMELIKPILQQAMTEVELITEETTIEIDDKIAEAVRRVLGELGLLPIPQTAPGAGIGVTIGEIPRSDSLDIGDDNA